MSKSTDQSARGWGGGGRRTKHPLSQPLDTAWEATPNKCFQVSLSQHPESRLFSLLVLQGAKYDSSRLHTWACGLGHGRGQRKGELLSSLGWVRKTLSQGTLQAQGYMTAKSSCVPTTIKREPFAFLKLVPTSFMLGRKMTMSPEQSGYQAGGNRGWGRYYRHRRAGL